MKGGRRRDVMVNVRINGMERSRIKVKSLGRKRVKLLVRIELKGYE